MGNQRDFVLNPLEAAYDRLKAREPTLTHEALAGELGFHKTQFSKWCNREPIPEKWWRPLARRLAADAEEEVDLVRGFASWAAISVKDALANARVRALRYGHIDLEELGNPVNASGRSTGPTGILVECFHRFSESAGEAPLDPEPERWSLTAALKRPNPGLILLGNIATVDRLKSVYFFCTPISIGIQGLIRLQRKDDASIEGIRTALSGKNREWLGQIAPIFMQDEIGSHIVRSLLDKRRGKIPCEFPIADLNVTELARTLSHVRVESNRWPVLLVDELTCLLALKKCSPQNVALAFSDKDTPPRFPFGFSIARESEALIKWCKGAWELYLQTDSDYIVEKFIQTYDGLCEFANQLQDCFGPTHYARKPKAWAARVLGVDMQVLRSKLIDAAWQPIVEQVYERIHKRRAASSRARSRNQR